MCMDHIVHPSQIRKQPLLQRRTFSGLSRIEQDMCVLVCKRFTYLLAVRVRVRVYLCTRFMHLLAVRVHCVCACAHDSRTCSQCVRACVCTCVCISAPIRSARALCVCARAYEKRICSQSIDACTCLQIHSSLAEDTFFGLHSARTHSESQHISSAQHHKSQKAVHLP